MSGLTGLFIANSYQYLVLKQDTDKEAYTNGLGTPIYVNGDPIGTIKMFYPISGTLSDYFDSNGVGVTGSGWWGWNICDGRNGTPDLRGRFAVGKTDANPDLGNPNANKTDFLVAGATGGSSQIDISNLPPHRHRYFDGYNNSEDSGTDLFSQKLEAFANLKADEDGPALGQGIGIKEGIAASREASISERNTGDGRDNINNQDELNAFQDDFNPPYVSVLYVIKVI